MLTVVADAAAREELTAGLDELVREGARRMLAAGLEAEVEAYLAAHREAVDQTGRRLVVRNGHARPRQVTTVAGAVEVRAPRVDDRRVGPATGTRQRFRSALLPPWCRRSPKVTEVLPLLYLHGLSSGDFVPTLAEFFGSAAGLSASTITRLTTSWQEEQRRFAERDLSDVIPGNPGAAGLGTQGDERARRAAEVGAAGRPQGARRDPRRRRSGARRPGDAVV